MAYFALLWKARAVEKYRLKYEKEKINSIAMAEIEMPKKTLFQKWRHYKYDTQKRISRRFREWYPEDSTVSNFLILLKTDQTVPNFVLKSLIGFIGGIVLTYIFFIFFVFQLSISFMHAIIMSSIIGILLTLGLAFSYRTRCLVFLLIPQFFSRVGRYTLTCYALVLILTGPATNTLKNSEVLSESMACTQEQIKTNAQQLNESLKKPINVMKESIKPIMDRFNDIANKLKWTTVKINRLTLSIVSVIQSNFSYLKSITKQCNQYLGTPYRRCIDSLEEGLQDCLETFGRSWLSDAMYIAKAACSEVLVHKKFCAMMEYLEEDIIAGVKKKIETFSERLACLLNMEVNIHHSYKFSSNGSRSTSQVTAGIVTEIRKRADPLLTWLSWSSCVTSLSLLFIIFRAKYYQHMYETRSRFDNRYITQELRDLDLKRLREGRDTILPLNRRERAKYITTTSFSLVASERLYMSRSAVFMSVTTFKLLIHMVADYSLYWVLMTIRYHGKRQSPMQAGVPETGAHVTGSGFVTNLLRSIIETLNIPLESPVPSPIPCLPNPIPPDFKRYTQIGLLIFLLWFFALFEPYGLRLRHVVMGHYRPERAKTRAVWLYNHILRTRGSFMKLARRKLHKEYKYSSESKHTFKRWLDSIIPLQCLRTLLGTSPVEPHCLLCGTRSVRNDLDSDLIRCETRDCPGIYCMRCFSDIGQLCTICMSPTDYGDLSDIDLEKGSSGESDPSEYEYDDGKDFEDVTHRSINWYKQDDDKEDTKTKGYDKHYKCRFYSDDSNRDNIPLLPEHSHIPSKRKEISSYTQYDHNLLNLFKLIHIETKKLFDHSVLLYDFDNKNLFNKIICDSQNNKILCLSNYSICRPRAHSNNKYFNKPSKLFTCHTQGYRNSVNSENKNSNIKSEFYKFVISRRLLLTEILTQTTAYEIVKDKSSIVVTKIKRDNELSTRLKRKFSLLRRRKKNRDKSQQNCRNIFRYYMNIVNQNICNFNKDLPENVKNNLKSNNTKNRNNDKKKEKKSKKKSKIPNISKNITKEADVQKSKDPKKSINTSKFSVICSKYWNNFKWNLIPCTEFVKISKRQTIASKSLNNFKRRKKPVQEAKLNEDNKAPIENKEDMRNFKLSAYLYEQEWVKMKCNDEVETTADNLQNISEEQEQKVKYDIIETKSLIEEVMNDNNMANSFNKELIQQLSETIEEGVKDLSQTPDVICMSLLNRYHRRAKALKCFGRKVKCTDNTTSPVASFKRNDFIDKGCCVGQKSKPVNRRNKKCVKCSCPLNQRDLLTSSCKGNSEANKDNKEAANLTEEDLNDKEEDADCEIGKVLDDKDESKKCDEDGKGFEKYAVLFEKLQNSYLTIKKFYSTIFTELFVKSNTCRNCTCETSDMKEVKVEKATRVRPRTRSCGCQCLTRNQEQTTQIGRPLVEVSQSVSEKFALDEEVDATHHRHTCTCAAQQVILSRDVGTLRKSHRRFATTGDKASIKFNVSSSSLDSFKSISSNSSDGTKTDTTICSVVTFYDDITHHNRSDINNDTRHRRADYKPEQYRHTRAEYDERARHRPRKYRTKVVTKTNQSTLTDKTKFCDVSTITNDWWSPIVEKKDLKGLETRRHYVRKKEKKYLKNTGVCTDGKIVTFRSRTQIIPPGTIDILSPSRYLLESQRYYNELFAYNLYNPHFVGFSQTQKRGAEKHCSLSKRSHRHRVYKSKRLEQCYSPRKQ